MKILVDRLKGTPTDFRFEPDDPGWAEARDVVPELSGELAETPTASVRAHRMGADLYLEGELDGALELECSRCLARYRHPLHEPFRLVLEPAGARVPSEPEAARDLARLGMCLGEELELGWLQGPEIDLRAFLREVVALALPVQPLCREDCRGLCPRCGADRNVEPCRCRPERSQEDEGAREGKAGAEPGTRPPGEREESKRSRSPFAVLEALRRSENEGES